MNVTVDRLRLRAETSTTQSGPTQPAPGEPTHGTAADAHADRATQLFLRATKNDGVLYLGMNSERDQCDLEAQAIRRSGPGVRRVVAHGERGVGADCFRLSNGDVVDLGSRAGAERFAHSLGLDRPQAAAVATILVDARPGSRDELAQIASVFAEAERGKAIPSRLVLSGHSTGAVLFDGKGELGVLYFSDLFALADVMPRAAGQIEDVMLSACSTGYDVERPSRTRLSAWREHFPNLKTAWAYGGQRDFHSPTGAGAIRDIVAWEEATRGRQDTLHRHERNVSTWTVPQGYVQAK